jgi:hypothetical protein
MSLDKIVEELIKKARERGEFDNLPGKGKPIDLSEYFETPEEVRVAQSVLKNAGFKSLEVELFNDIAALKQILASTTDDEKKHELQKRIQEKQIELSLRMEKRPRK